ncbi:MAG: hypothetical protein M3M89_04490 [Thermoproteota archaeon]|nr:hypothetical protein [Thermoproteota archaeon]
MNKTATSAMSIASALAAIGLLVASSFTVTVYAHGHLILTPDIENVNPISLVLGHSNEPAFGVEPGVHDGMHSVEVSLEDTNTTLPLVGADLRIDKYYFRDFESFQNATSPEQADQVEQNITVGEVFGEPGQYRAPQIVQPGIYGYRLYGTINYFEVAEVPIDTVFFCTLDSDDDGITANTSKFNSEGWGGEYGCVSDINDIYFPTGNDQISTANSETASSEQQETMNLPEGNSSSSGIFP